MAQMEINIGDRLVQRVGLHKTQKNKFIMEVTRITPTNVMLKAVGRSPKAKGRTFTMDLRRVLTSMVHEGES